MSRENALFLQIYRDLLEKIRAGTYPDGEKLPTEKELAASWSVARITARHALQRLEDEGYIERFPRRGSFVRKIVSGEAGVSPVIVLIMGEYTHDYGYEIISGMLETCAAYGYHLLIKESGNDQKKEEQIFRELDHLDYAGLLVQPSVGETYNPWLIQSVYLGRHLVLFDRMLPGISAPYVGTNNEQLSAYGVTKLLENGHEQIALLTLTGEQTSSIRERIQGFMSACARFGVPVHYDLWMDNLQGKDDMRLPESEQVKGYAKKIAAHLKRHPQITAVYGTENRMTLAALEAIRMLHLRIPEDISVIGFDRPETEMHIAHAQQNQRLIGKRAVERLHRMIRDGDRTPSLERVPGKWVEGASIRDLRSKT